jgi:hypothetical protein
MAYQQENTMRGPRVFVTRNYDGLQSNKDKFKAKESYGDLYRILQNIVGQRAKAIPRGVTNEGNTNQVLNPSVPISQIPTADNAYDLGSATYSWRSVYAYTYYDAGGNALGSFKAIAVPSGTAPVADSIADTLTLIAGAGLSITGNAGADSITFAIVLDASDIDTNIAGFGSLLSAVDDTVQKALDTIDNKALDKTGDTTSGPIIFGDDATFNGEVFVDEGVNKRMGVATLVAGTVTVNTTAVAANSRIFLTINTPGGTVGAVYISARTAGTSFAITSTSATDTSTVAWLILSPS